MGSSASRQWARRLGGRCRRRPGLGLWVEWKALEELLGYLLVMSRGGPGDRADCRRRQGEDAHDDAPPVRYHQPVAPRAHRMITGVPTGISFASLSMSALRIRMQPCEIAPGISFG
jgi:hypothetical protein